MRTVSVHPSKSIRFTKCASIYCTLLNQYKKKNPEVTFKQMSEEFGLSETNCRRYYYGVHHVNGGYHSRINYTQMREGACVTI